VHLWSYRLVQNWFCNVTCSEEVLGGSGAIVLLELVLTSRISTVSICSSFASISASGVAAISCCSRLSTLGMFLAASWLVLGSDGLGEAGAGFLITRLVIIFLFLVKTRGATLAEVCLRLEAD